MEDARLATEDDLSAMNQINSRFRSSIIDKRGGELYISSQNTNTEQRLLQALNQTNSVLVVGLFDSYIFGYALCMIEELSDGTRLGKLTDFIVDSDARKVGIGESMMNLTVQQLRDSDCSYIDSVALPGDRETKNFFESFGLKARLLTVNRKI